MKLTNDMRSLLAKKAADEKFNPEIDKITKQIGRVALDLYELAYPPHIRKRMSELPHGAFQQQSDVDLRHNGKRYTIQLPESRMVFAMHHYGIRVEDAPAEKIAEGVSLKEELESTVRRRNDLVHKLRRELSDITTDKKLLELWPESKKFVDEICGHRPVANPPAVIKDFQYLIASA